MFRPICPNIFALGILIIVSFRNDINNLENVNNYLALTNWFIVVSEKLAQRRGPDKPVWRKQITESFPCCTSKKHYIILFLDNPPL